MLCPYYQRESFEYPEELVCRLGQKYFFITDCTKKNTSHYEFQLYEDEKAYFEKHYCCRDAYHSCPIFNAGLIPPAPEIRGSQGR